MILACLILVCNGNLHQRNKTLVPATLTQGSRDRPQEAAPSLCLSQLSQDAAAAAASTELAGPQTRLLPRRRFRIVILGCEDGKHPRDLHSMLQAVQGLLSAFLMTTMYLGIIIIARIQYGLQERGVSPWALAWMHPLCRLKLHPKTSRGSRASTCARATHSSTQAALATHRAAPSPARPSGPHTCPAQSGASGLAATGLCCPVCLSGLSLSACYSSTPTC